MEERVAADGAIPSYAVHGQGQPLVLIMGLGGTKEAWGLQVHAFKRRYRVITFDNRGVGRTGVGQQPITVEVMAHDTITLLDHLGIDSAHILGYSLGGLVAQEVAIRFPQRVKKLILVSTVALGAEPDPSTAGIPNALGMEPAEVQQGMKSADLEKILPALTERAFNRRGYRLLLRPMTRLFMQRIELDGLAGQLMAAARARTLDRLGSIQAATMVLTGTGDRLVDPAASRVLASRIPNAKLVMIEGGSHAFAIEMSRHFNRAVLDFLKES